VVGLIFPREEAALKTEFPFTLPRGYVDATGTIHRHGLMRLATAMDEIEPLRDVRVQANQAYLAIILLARVIIRLGDLPNISTHIIEQLFAGDLAYLQAFYRQINDQGTTKLAVVCAHCQQTQEVNLTDLGEFMATP
jgi:hypothetical protein